MVVDFYTKTNCELCDEARIILEMVQQQYGFQLREHDIYEGSDQMFETYHLIIPAIQVDGELVAYGNIDLETVELYFKSEKNRK
ncbi:glutaredoxin-like protein [Gracilibacillus halophilus YIM-C55.5]|uniref:Glutaredoxin-like protein n=1 Tax=Gracilibacillus halophilus YIM-C55.5 TaxID=1308866 RepID=N4W9F7_9BACI|nr:glutaredoxin family protein [Gracilibacillus halophilus]ENH96913.1 glutaredoxin-like protein [Gracilibacillus halophilus YIM-C55.5]